ncbi:delta-6 fatty acid desaturase [Trypanosoma grayi]|uniref:delta-6 fatty acid desaturase n=1 Tax=Trypanosoma grayi TaxID=71804 RepID=UPI0004F42AB1|nr:delta-6 fatty acid desaturase [Trypanosoma grayi]KEG08428.1 delta-6 fatty acid desaturase [Trypanosoma grayi]
MVVSVCGDTAVTATATAADDVRGGVDDVVRIDGVYYDTARLAATHPGGAMMVNMANGTDGTRIFLSYHRRRFPHEKYKHLQVAAADVRPGAVPESEPPKFDRYLELCELVRPVLAPTGGFAPLYYYIKALLWCVIVIGLDLYALFAWRPHYLTIIQSMAMAMMGLNVQHDANHGALSRNPMVNGLFGLTQDLIGGSRISWIIHHNFIHHIYTNEPKRDLDLDIPLLRLHRFVPKRSYYALQQMYFIVLEAVFGPVHVISNALFLWHGPNERQKFLRGVWNISRVMTLIPPLRLAFNFLHAPSLFDAVLGSFLQYALGGMYLAFFFVISHNFCGAKKEGTSDGKCFLAAQVETSSNVGGWLLAQLNGGLNYQIEHHLFPRVHHGYYCYLAPIVQVYCAKHGIPYTHFETVQDNVISTFDHLAIYGQGLEETKKA